ncbi:MAG: hypothetical protein ABI540_00890 [Spartobacteria bacterium]
MTASAGHAGDGKEIPVQQAPQLVSQDEWQFTLTSYFWLPSASVDISTPNVTVGNRTIGGDISINQPWWKTLGNFSNNFYVLSLSGRTEAWKGRWGGFLDGYWIFGKATVNSSNSKVVFQDRADITASSSVTSRFNTGQVNFGPQFKLGTAAFSPTSSVTFVVYGGGRVNWVGDKVDGSITVQESSVVEEIGQTTNFNGSASRAFIEPMLGLKTSWSFGENFRAILRGDVGGFGAVDGNNWDCDLETGIAWQAWKNTYIDLGYRARGQWQGLGSNSKGNLRGWYFGPELGLTISF